MGEEKQIEEMARDICPYKDEYVDCKQCDTELDIGDYPCCYKGFAKQLYEKGYRRASEVAREIFAEIDLVCVDVLGEFNFYRYNELKKKYESEDTE